MNDSVSYAVDIPGYSILRKLGQGGMATVYLAEEARLGRQVALKIMSEDLSQGSNFAERFLAEGRMAAGLHHPNIVTIYNMGVAGDHYFISMEYIEGEPLSARIRSGVTPEFAVHTAKRIAVALGSAHARGILHRDIKPSNILFRENRFAVLADFGIAKALESDSELTLAGSVLGTPSYMSPQQASGQKIDHRSDLYSLGVVLFEMLASKRPFMGDTPVATALKHATEPIPRLPQPIAHFQPIIDRILAKSPVDRFQDAEEFIQALDAIEVSDVLPTGDRATMVLDQDVVQSLWEASPDSYSGIEPSSGGSTGGSLPSIKLNQLTNAFTRVKPKLAMLAGLILLALAIGKFIDWKTERDFQRRMEINELSVQAKKHVVESRFIEPNGNNAVTAYRKILELDSDNDLAIKGLAAIEKRFEQEVTDTKANEGPKQALSRAEIALHAFPDSPVLKQLHTSIEQELAVRELKSRIAALLATAKQQESELRLTEPERDNAYSNYREILRLDPDNDEASQGLDRIVARYQAWARDSEGAGDLPKALDMAEKGLRIAPENSELLTLRSNIQTSLDLEKRIADSLDQAARRIEQGQLLEPEEENAFAAVARVLDWDPDNPKALELKSTIESLYVRGINEAFEQGELRRGLAMVEQGRKVFKEQEDLAKLGENIRRELALKEMLQSAEDHFDSGRLIQPPGENARELYQKIAQQYPDNRAAAQGLQRTGEQIAALAREKLEAGVPGEALNLAREGLKALPDDAKLLAMEKEISDGLGQKARMSALLDQARNQIAQNRFLTPEKDNAFATVQEINKLDPGNKQAKVLLDEIATVFLDRAQNLAKEGNVTQAEEAVRQGLRVDPEQPQLIALRSKLVRDVQQTQETRRLDQLLKQAGAQMDQGYLIQPAGDNAFVLYQKILELAPGNADAKRGLAEVKARIEKTAHDARGQGDLQQAASVAAAGLERFPEDRSLIALSQELKGLLAEGETQAEIPALLKTAEGQFKQLQLTNPAGDNALESYKKILQLDPGNGEAKAGIEKIAGRYHQLALSQQRSGRLKQAKLSVQRGLAVVPDHVRLKALRNQLQSQVALQDRIGTLLRKAEGQIQQKRWTKPKGDNAVETLRAALKLEPRNQKAQAALRAIAAKYGGLAQQSLKAGNLAQTAQQVQLGLDIDPSSQGLRALRAALENKQNSMELINALLAKAARQMDAQKLLEPANDNAFESISAVLRLDLNNRQATAARDKIAALYEEKIRRRQQVGDLKQSQSMIRLGLEKFPQQQSLIALDKEIHALLAQQKSAEDDRKPASPEEGETKALPKKKFRQPMNF